MTIQDLYLTNRLGPIIERGNAKRTTKVSQTDVLMGLILTEKSLQEIDGSAQVWRFETTEAYLEQFIMSFDFETIRTEVEHETTIPYLTRFHTKVAVKSRGEKWVLHKYDADPFPSNPHAHNFDQNLKLDLSNGGLFRKRERTASISMKELLEIRMLFEQKGFLMPPLSEYKQG